MKADVQSVCGSELLVYIVEFIKLVHLTVITYNAVGQLWCTLCNCPVKTNLLWNSHVQGRTHKEVPTVTFEFFLFS